MRAGVGSSGGNCTEQRRSCAEQRRCRGRTSAQNPSGSKSFGHIRSNFVGAVALAGGSLK